MTLLTMDPVRICDAGEDPRLAVFRSPHALEVFQSVCQKDQVWRRDVYDVHDIHEPAREVFYSTLDRALSPKAAPGECVKSTGPAPSGNPAALDAGRQVAAGPCFPADCYGRLLLLLGEAGSGKTHLMRAFRTYVHGNRLGYCGYMQMTAATENYGRYVLANLIDSLDDPYFEGEIDRSGLMTLSQAVVERAGLMSPEEIERLRTGEMPALDLAQFTVELADRFVSDKRFDRLDPDVLRAVCYVQRDDARLKSRVLKFLRCEPLGEFDRAYIPGLEARLHDHHPQEMVEQLGRLMWAVERKSLVLLVDQMEDMANFDFDPGRAEVRFRRAIQTLCAMAGAIPSSVFVVSCLEDFYRHLRDRLTGSARDRLENDPEPVRLTATRGRDEVEKIVEYRLGALYAAAGVESSDPYFPFPSVFLGQLAGLRTRDVLDRCRKFRVASPEVQSHESALIATPATAPGIDLQQAWNDFRTSYKANIPESDESQAEILAAAISACHLDLPAQPQFTVELDERQLIVGLTVGISGDLLDGADSLSAKLQIAICNKTAQGGHLARQIAELRKVADDRIPVSVRSGEFPGDPRSRIAGILAEFAKAGGRRASIEDSHWRMLLALEQFHLEHCSDPHYAIWRQTERPLARLKPLIDILQLDRLASDTTSAAE